MSKKKPSAPVMSLNDIAGFTAVQAADQCVDRYQARTRAFVEMGKLVYHIEAVTGLPKGQSSIYGMLQKKGMPEGSVHNARLVSNFIAAFVITGLVTESRADEIITHRVVNQCGRILSGKSAAKMSAEELAPLLNAGEKAAIGDELDCIDEHGMTIAARKESEEKRKAEEARVAAAAAEAAKLPPVAETPAPAAAPAAETPAPAPAAETPAPAPAAETPAPAPASESSHAKRPANAAEVIAKIAEVELQSYDLDADGLATVRAKLAEWIDLLDSSIDAAKKPVEAKAA